jgi:DNA replicative helicase MCM subunit Mcm2 (Cdc46/Mcm family)
VQLKEIPSALKQRFDIIFTKLERLEDDESYIIHRKKLIKGELEQPIPAELVPKYISYVRRLQKDAEIVWSDEVIDSLNGFFKSLRSGTERFRKGLLEKFETDRKVKDREELERTQIATRRHLDGLYRIAVAVASIRLNFYEENGKKFLKPDLKDAEFAEDILLKSLKQSAYDPESKTFDIDTIETQTTLLTKRIPQIIQEVIQNAVSQHGLNAKIQKSEIIQAIADKARITYEVAERYFAEIMEKSKTIGDYGDTVVFFSEESNGG